MKIKTKMALTTSIDSTQQDFCCRTLNTDFHNRELRLYFKEMESETKGEIKGYLFQLDESFKAHIWFFCPYCGEKIE